MFKTVINLNSKIFKSAERRRVLSSVVSKNAREFRDSTKQKMAEQTPTGKVYNRGAGLRRRHRASARGERPAIETGNLLRNIKSRDVSELKSIVEINLGYADILQASGREIITEKDLSEARLKLSREVDNALKTLG